MTTIETVTGRRPVSELGITLMHEHLLIGWPGWESDTAAPRYDRAEVRRKCVDRMAGLKQLGLGTLLDPCPIDLGRDVELAAEVAQATGVNIVCATGLYKEDQGAAPYFRFRSAFTDVVSEMTETFVRELTEGIGSSGIKAGVIKVATGKGQITAYERMVLTAAARAHKETGAPITTHTEEGTMGREQIDVLTAEGVSPQRIVVGHSCGSADLRYHTDMLDRGAYLGFDKQIVLSHDSVWCWRGRPFDLPEHILPKWRPTHLFEEIVPALRGAGVPQEKIDNLLVHNPRRYFER